MSARKYARGTRRHHNVRSTRGSRRFRSGKPPKTGCAVVLVLLGLVAPLGAVLTFGVLR